MNRTQLHDVWLRGAILVVAMMVLPACAVPARSLRGVDVVAGELASQPYLGIQFTDADDGRGVKITGIVPGAFTAGGSAAKQISIDDVILEVNRQPVAARNFADVFKQMRPGDRCDMLVRRTNGDVVSLSFAVPSRAAYAGPAQFPLPSRLRNWQREAERISLERSTPMQRLGAAVTEAQREHQDNPVEVAKLQQYLSSRVLEACGFHALTHLAFVFGPVHQVTTFPEHLSRVASPLTSDPAQMLNVATTVLDAGSLPRINPVPVPYHDDDALFATVGAMLDESDDQLDRAFAQIPASQRDVMAGNMRGLLEVMTGDANMASRDDAPALLRAMRQTMLVDYQALLAAGQAMMPLVDTTRYQPPTLKGSTSLSVELRRAVTGPIIAARKHHGRWIVIGSDRDNTYDMSRIAVVIESGGNDSYEFAPTRAGDIKAVVDFSGNDQYIGNGAGPAGAVMGVQIIVDHAGNDTYRGTAISNGAAVLGVGVLVDYAGDDKYIGTVFTQGAAMYGFGAAIDLGQGSDSYVAAAFSQGLGGPRGLGLLLNDYGEEFYRANGELPSVYGTPATYFGMSQGVGVGHRPFDNGGVGWLIDHHGNDRYEAGEFSQGGGYFTGMGVLQDHGGRDLYFGGRYAQGFAAHQAAGLFVDHAGDDQYYSSSAAGQGFAWDESLALCLDMAGNDSYRADNLSQGSAAQQAIGMLIDVKGNDIYSGGGASVQGRSGQNEYHFKTAQVYSWSLLLDLGGMDTYSSGLQNNSRRVTDMPSDDPAQAFVHGMAIDLEMGGDE